MINVQQNNQRIDLPAQVKTWRSNPAHTGPGDAPDYDLIYVDEGEFHRIGSMWSNKESNGQRKPVVQLELGLLPKGVAKIRAYICPKRTRKPKPEGAA